MENEKQDKEEKQQYQEFILEGETYSTLLTKKWLSRKPFQLYDPNKIKSFIPGTIVKVFIKEGQKVKKGESLLILEAMKMNNLILAPSDGVISKIHVSEGDKVANKQLLVELEEKEIKTKEKKEKEKKKKRKK